MVSKQITHRFGPKSQQHCIVVEGANPSWGTGGFDLVGLVHGGFWRAEKTPESMMAMAREIADLGAKVACLGYRTVETGVELAEMLSDLRHGIAAALRSPQIGEHTRLLIVGHSAGGYLALRLAELLHGVTVVGLAPITLFEQPSDTALGDCAVLALHANSTGTEHASIQDSLSVRLSDEDGVVSNDVIVVHGTDDQTVPVEMTQRFALRGRHPVQVHLVGGARHMDLIKPERDAGQYVIRLLSERMSQNPW
jgi:acetyl esterase/lipase